MPEGVGKGVPRGTGVSELFSCVAVRVVRGTGPGRPKDSLRAGGWRPRALEVQWSSVKVQIMHCEFEGREILIQIRSLNLPVCLLVRDGFRHRENLHLTNPSLDGASRHRDTSGLVAIRTLRIDSRGRLALWSARSTPSPPERCPSRGTSSSAAVNESSRRSEERQTRRTPSSCAYQRFAPRAHASHRRLDRSQRSAPRNFVVTSSFDRQAKPSWREIPAVFGRSREP